MVATGYAKAHRLWYEIDDLVSEAVIIALQVKIPEGADWKAYLSTCIRNGLSKKKSAKTVALVKPVEVYDDIPFWEYFKRPEMVEMVAMGKTTAEVAKEYNVSVRTIQRYLKEELND